MQMQVQEDFQVFEALQQPIAFPTMSPEKIFDWLGGHLVWFQRKPFTESTSREKMIAMELNPNCEVPLLKGEEAVVSNYEVFRDYFEICYATEGLVFLKPKSDEERRKLKAGLYDPYECICMYGDEPHYKKYPIRVFLTHLYDAEKGQVEEVECVECYATLSVKDFKKHVFREKNVRHWLDEKLEKKLEEWKNMTFVRRWSENLKEEEIC